MVVKKLGCWVRVGGRWYCFRNGGGDLVILYVVVIKVWKIRKYCNVFLNRSFLRKNRLDMNRDWKLS